MEQLEKRLEHYAPLWGRFTPAARIYRSNRCCVYTLSSGSPEEDVSYVAKVITILGQGEDLERRAAEVRQEIAALEQLIELGCDRILTSGQQSDAVKGIPLIAELVRRADGRIIIMPGCGVRENNIARIEAETGAREFHTSARSVVYSRMEYRNENVPMGSSVVTSEFETVRTDREKVRAYL